MESTIFIFYIRQALHEFSSAQFMIIFIQKAQMDLKLVNYVWNLVFEIRIFMGHYGDEKLRFLMH